MKLRLWWVLMLIAVALLPLAVAGQLMIGRAERTARESVRVTGARAAAVAAPELEAYVDAQIDLVRTIGTAMAPASKTTLAQETQIARLYQLVFPRLRSIDLLGEDGCTPIATTRIEGLPRTPCAEPAIATALRAGNAYRGSIELSADDVPVMTIAVPLEIAGERVGAVVAELDMIAIWTLLHELHVGSTGFARLVSDDGILIGHGDLEERRQVFRRERDPHVDAARAAGERGVRYRDRQGRDVFALAMHLPHLPWTVIVEQPVAEAFAPVRAMERELYLMVVAALLLAMVGGLLAGRGPVRTIEKMRAQVKEFSRGNLAARGPTPQIQELRSLAAGLTEMADELTRLQTETARRERLATFARVAAGLAHDLKAPIFAVRNACERALAADSPDEATEAIRQAIDRDLPRLHRYVDDLGRLSRRESVQVEMTAIDPRAVADAIVAEAASAGRWLEVTFEATGQARAASADERLVIRALTNLVGNAADACLLRRPPGGRVTIEVGETPEELVFAVRDTGPGLTGERLAEVLARDFESDKRESGVGLGLGVVKQVAVAHGGRLEAESERGAGSVFRLHLPRRAVVKGVGPDEVQRIA